MYIKLGACEDSHYRYKCQSSCQHCLEHHCTNYTPGISYTMFTTAATMLFATMSIADYTIPADYVHGQCFLTYIYIRPHYLRRGALSFVP